MREWVLNYNFRTADKKPQKHCAKRLQCVFIFPARPKTFLMIFIFIFISILGFWLCTYFAWIFNFKFVIVYTLREETKGTVKTNKDIYQKKKKNKTQPAAVS